MFFFFFFFCIGKGKLFKGDLGKGNEKNFFLTEIQSPLVTVYLK